MIDVYPETDSLLSTQADISSNKFLYNSLTKYTTSVTENELKLTTEERGNCILTNCLPGIVNLDSRFVSCCHCNLVVLLRREHHSVQVFIPVHLQDGIEIPIIFFGNFDRRHRMKIAYNGLPRFKFAIFLGIHLKVMSHYDELTVQLPIRRTPYNPKKKKRQILEHQCSQIKVIARIHTKTINIFYYLYFQIRLC